MIPVIKSTELSKWFGEVVAVNKMEVEIGSGVTGLLGPNGAGKTTFLKMALGLYKPSRGSITVLGEAPRGNLDVLRRIGYCPEAHLFYDHMTGFDFVYWMNRCWGMDKATARKSAEEACELVRMTDRMHDKITKYSHGMRQRINLAQSLATNPDILFLDEPMAGLDPESREETFALVRRMGTEGKTVVVSSHILHEVERVTNNVVLLHNGSVLAHGEVRHIRELIDEHPHTVTVESPQFRQLADKFVNDDSTLSIDFADGTVTIRTKDPNRFYQRFNDLVLEENIEIVSVSCPDDNLQSVFDYLVG